VTDDPVSLPDRSCPQGFDGAEKRGDQYFSAHKVYCIIKDGPRKGEEYCCASFERLHTLAQLKAAAAEMQRYLDQHK